MFFVLAVLISRKNRIKYIEKIILKSPLNQYCCDPKFEIQNGLNNLKY